MTTDNENRLTSRRGFLGNVAAGVTLFHIVPRHVLGGSRYVTPSETVNVALVGAGGRGTENARELMKLDDVQITTIVDPAEHWDLSGFYYRGTAGRKPARAAFEKHYSQKRSNYQCAEYADFREMLDKAGDVDAVLCATPDHAHATVSLAAMRAGKHVYCEKPLTHNVAEARLVARVAKETGLATQMGNQGHANEGIRQTVEWLHAGAIGTVSAVHAWVPATRWNVALKGVPAETDPVPAGLDWDLWLGPRTARPFRSSYAPVSWRDYWEFGCGAMGDFGCHDLDSACWALNLKAPTSVEMYPAGFMNKDIAPYGEIGYFDFAAEGDQQAVRINWYSGGLQPRRPDELPEGRELPRRGVLFVGDKGILVCGGAGGAAELFPESRRAEFQIPEPTIPRSNGHHRDWIDAVKGGPAASSNFEYGARLTEITLLGVAALRTGKRLMWDAQNMTARGVPEAEEILNGTYRAGWELT